MEMEYVLWGRKQGEDAIDEKVITSTTSLEHLAKAKAWARANGYPVLRVTTIDGKVPDFTTAIKGVKS